MAKDPVDIHIGSRLRLLRDRRKLTLQAIGRQIGTTYQQVRKYEAGDNRISAATLYRLSALLDVEPAFFFEGLPAPDFRREGPDERPAPAEPGRYDGGFDETMAAVLERIEDAEVRQHMASLLRLLDGRSRPRRSSR